MKTPKVCQEQERESTTDEESHDGYLNPSSACSDKGSQL
eukprot:IDg8537t1